MTVSVAALLGIAAAPLLPARRTLDCALLLKPELAKANPQLVRELCLEFYAHPKREYRMAAAMGMQSFRDSQVRSALSSMVANDLRADVKQRAMLSLVNQQDASLDTTIASLYWAQPEVRSVVDARVSLFGLASLKAEIQRSKP